MFFISRQPQGGLGYRPFSFSITPTRWCGNGCPNDRPHPGLTNLEFATVYYYFYLDTFGLLLAEKTGGVSPG